MSQIKQALKAAIMKKADCVKIEANCLAELIINAQSESLDELGQVSDDDLRAFMNDVLPNLSAVAESQPVQGLVPVNKWGELKLIGCLAPSACLYVFIPPQGNPLFEETWHKLTNKTQEPIDNPFMSASAQKADEVETTYLAPTTEQEDSSLLQSENIEDVSNPFSMNALAQSSEQEPVASSEEASPAEQDEAYELDFSPQPFEADTSPKYLKADEDDELDFTPQPIQSEDDETYDATPRETLHEVALDTQDDMESSIHFQAPQTSNYPVFERPDHDDIPSRAVEPTHSVNTSEFTNAKAPGNTDKPQHDSPASSQITEHPPIQTLVSPREIHFGAHVPGESIDPAKSNEIDNILREMITSGASDLHLTLGKPVCLRVDGEIKRIPGNFVDEQQMRRLLLPIMPEKNRHDFAEENDTDFGYEVEGLARFRVNIFRDINGVGAVLRQIPSDIPSANQLNLPDPIRKLCGLSKGLVLVTGPTGSGKSTTLASMLDLINESRYEHILTVEDPIEFVHPQKKCLVNQREVHKHTQSFSRALRAALREDPDIILIGEMRDLETIGIAIETAETGHLVFGTLHTNTAVSTIDRLVDQFPADQQSQIRIMLAESLKGVVCQTLVKKKGGGRVAAHEILIVDRAVSSLIREKNTHMIQNQMQTQKSKGNQQLNDALLHLVQNEIVDANDAYHKAIDKEGFMKLLAQKGLAGEVNLVS